MTRAPVEYRSVSSIRGPLLSVEGVSDVDWDELVEIQLDSGEVRHGVVLDIDRELAVVQVFEGTSGLALAGTRVSFAGSPMRIPVGEAWLGRVCNGSGSRSTEARRSSAPTCAKSAAARSTPPRASPRRSRSSPAYRWSTA